jgi:hypothetical protein
MKKLVVPALLVAGLTVSALVGATSVAWAQPDPNTHGVPAAQANAACAGIVGKERPAEASFNVAVAAYNTVSNGDDAAFSAIPVEWQKLIQVVEDHADYLAAAGLQRGSITCDGPTAVFPDLRLANDVRDAICDNARPDLIASPALRTRVDAALAALGRGYQRAHSDCAPAPTTTPQPTTTPPTTTPEPTDEPDPTTAPPAADNDNDDDGLNPGPIVPAGSGSVFTPVGGVETGGGPA